MRHVLRFGLVVAFVAGCGLYVRADEGMWPLNRFPSAVLTERYGFTPTPQWLEKIQLGSVRFAGGCSGSFVSASGLVMTNYHCVVDCVAALSDRSGTCRRAASTPQRRRTSGDVPAWS